MNLIVLWTLIIAINLNYCWAKDLPSFIKKCKIGDPGLNRCLKQRIEDIKPYLLKGLPELKLPAIEPLNLPKLEVRTGNGNGIGFNATFSDIEVYGVKDFVLADAAMDFEKLMLYLDIHIPQIMAHAQYKFNGKILLFELSGAGAAQINITDIHAWGNRTFSIAENNGMRYVTFGDVTEAHIEYEGISMYFDKLFKDNEQLTRDVNKIVNDNYDAIGKEINPFIYNSLYIFIQGTMQEVFNEFSVEELFD